MNNKRNYLLRDFKPRHQQRKKKKTSQSSLIGIIFVSCFLVYFWWPSNEDDSLKTITHMEPIEIIQQEDNELIPEKEVKLDEEFTPPVLTPDSEAISNTKKIDLIIKSGDTLENLFIENNLNVADLFQIMSLENSKQYLKYLRPGDRFSIEHMNGDIDTLTKNLNLSKALHISKEDDGYVSSLVDKEIEKRKKFGYGKIKTSLFEAAIENGLTDKLIMNLASILAWDIDFVYDIRLDDDFFVLYEEIWQDGRYVTDGEIIALEFNNNGKKFEAIRYTNENGVSNYFTPNGNNMSKAFIRAPVDFTRVSSNFNPNRKHPILNTIRAHRGVDYAAPRGTKIRASGDGKIIFQGVKSGYGNVIILQHGSNITTLYAHMSDFNSAFKLGDRVRQNQVIGYVGSSGLATAPHLHYEYRVSGVHKNPRTVELPQAKPIQDKYLNDFLIKATSVMNELFVYKQSKSLSVAQNN